MSILRKILRSGTQSPLAYLAGAGLSEFTHLADFERGIYIIGGQWSSETAFFSAFSRSSTATFIEANGTQLIANNNVPRFNYSAGSRRLLLEGQATNLLLQSTNLTHAQWIKAGAVSVVAGGGLMGGESWGVEDDLSSGFEYIINPLGVYVANTVYTASLYVKKDPVQNNLQAMVRLFISGPNVQLGLFINPATGAFTAVGPIGAHGVIDLGTCWRFWFTASHAASGSAINFEILPGIASGALAVGKLEVSRPNVVQGTVLSSDIPTTSAAVTRAADTFLLPTEIRSIINSAQHTSFVGGRLSENISHFPRILGGDSATALIYKNGTTSQEVGTFNGASSVIVSPPIGNLSTGFKVSFAHNASGRALSFNGSVVASDANAPGARANVWLGRGGTLNDTNATFADGLYRLIAFAPTRISDARLREISTL